MKTWLNAKSKINSIYFNMALLKCEKRERQNLLRSNIFYNYFMGRESFLFESLLRSFEGAFFRHEFAVGKNAPNLAGNIPNGARKAAEIDAKSAHHSR